MSRQHPHAHRTNSSEKIDVTTTSTQSSTCPFGCNIAHITVANTTGSNLHYYQTGINPVALTDGTSSYIHAGQSEYIIVRPDTNPGSGDGEKIAAVATAGTATLFIDWVES
jgi:hypothetical protein